MNQVSLLNNVRACFVFVLSLGKGVFHLFQYTALFNIKYLYRTPSENRTLSSAVNAKRTGLVIHNPLLRLLLTVFNNHILSVIFLANPISHFFSVFFRGS